MDDTNEPTQVPGDKDGTHHELSNPEQMEIPRDLAGEDIKVARHPIFLSDNIVILLSVFESSNNFADCWTWEYSDPIKNAEVAAKQLMSQISEHCSVQFLWALRRAIKAEIEFHNAQFGSTHPIDEPEK